MRMTGLCIMRAPVIRIFCSSTYNRYILSFFLNGVRKWQCFVKCDYSFLYISSKVIPLSLIHSFHPFLLPPTA